jgi:hypothetical protein
MATERFSKAQFEEALPKHKDTKEKLWEHAGFIRGEHCYRMNINQDIVIQIRSSVNGNGFAAETGGNSIRAWLTDMDGEPLGSKVQAYVTRRPGWEKRLVDVLRELWLRAQKAGYCPRCKKAKGVYKVKKEGRNKGKLFAKCFPCDDGFEWLS